MAVDDILEQGTKANTVLQRAILEDYSDTAVGTNYGRQLADWLAFKNHPRHLGYGLTVYEQILKYNLMHWF